MLEYLNALKYVMDNGVDRDDRTGVGTRSVFGYMLKHDLNDGFPAITTKKLAFKSVVSELLWFLSASSDERKLAEIHYGKPREELIGKNTIWTANADAQGKDLGYTNTDLVKELGPVYGVQWRNWNGIDQIKTIIEQIKNNPNDRRIILSAWNVSDLAKMTLPPCHCFYQFYVANGELSCQIYARSQDLFLGTPFNISSAALLTHMLAQVCDLKVGEYIHTIGDGHIYNTHFDQVNEQLQRTPKTLPKLWLNSNIKNIDDFTMDDIRLENYYSYPTLKAPMAV